MTHQEAAACLIIALIHDEDENKNQRKTQNWIKKREQLGTVCKSCSRVTS